MSVGHFFTDEEREWVKCLYLNTEMTCEEIADRFNNTFDTSDKTVTKWAISDLMCKRMGVRRGFNRTQFGRGRVKGHAPLGTIYEKGKCKYARIKIGFSHSHEKGSDGKNYMHLHQYIYECHHGKIGDGEIVIFADGNQNNLSLDNLVKVSRRQNAILAKKGWHACGKATVAAVEVLSAEDAIRLIEERG